MISIDDGSCQKCCDYFIYGESQTSDMGFASTIKDETIHPMDTKWDALLAREWGEFISTGQKCYTTSIAVVIDFEVEAKIVAV